MTCKNIIVCDEDIDIYGSFQGVLIELVSIFKRENDKMRFDWSDSDAGFVSPDIPVP